MTSHLSHLQMQSSRTQRIWQQIQRESRACLITLLGWRQPLLLASNPMLPVPVLDHKRQLRCEMITSSVYEHEKTTTQILAINHPIVLWVFWPCDWMSRSDMRLMSNIFEPIQLSNIDFNDGYLNGRVLAFFRRRPCFLRWVDGDKIASIFCY